MDCTPAEAVEPIVSVTVAVVPGVIDVGEIVTLTPDALFADSAIAFFPLPVSVALNVNFAVAPVCAEPELADSLNAKSTLVGVNGLPQSFTSTAPSTDPSPVPRLYVPPLAVNPVTPGTLLLPEGVGWNGPEALPARAYRLGFALPCPLPPRACTSSAISPANDGDAAIE
jgi:hypothetical protein